MSQAKVLVVEDEVIVARDIQSRLSQLGYAVSIATTGDDAVRLAGDMCPDLIMMDIMLGRGRLDGIEAVELIHARCDVPVIFLTAFGDEQSLQRAKVTEPFGYVIKPFQTRELTVAIEIALHRHQLERRLSESNVWLSTTLASIGDAVIATDSEGTIKFTNRTAKSLLARDETGLVGANIRQVVGLRDSASRETLPNPVDTLIERGEQLISLIDVVLPTGRGEDKPVDVTAALILDHRSVAIGFVLVIRDITERRMAEEYVRYLAYHDSLTGLPNRTQLFDRIQAAMVQSRRHSRIMALIFLDLDDFKTVNDTYGHAAGDQLLRELAGGLRGCVREDDMVARLAGDEFIIVLTDVANLDDVKSVAAKILARMDQGFSVEAAHLVVTGSIGIAAYPQHGADVDILIRHADTAMYFAKQKGKNAFATYEAGWKSALPELEDAQAAHGVGP